MPGRACPRSPTCATGRWSSQVLGESCWPWLRTEGAACSWTGPPMKLLSGQSGRPTAPSWRSCEAAAISAKAAARCGSSSPKPTAPTFAGSRGVRGPASGVMARRSSGLPPATGWRSPAGGASPSSVSATGGARTARCCGECSRPCVVARRRVDRCHARGLSGHGGDRRNRASHGRDRPGVGRTHRLVAGWSQSGRVRRGSGCLGHHPRGRRRGRARQGRRGRRPGPGEGPAAASWSPSGDRLVYFTTPRSGRASRGAAHRGG